MWFKLLVIIFSIGTLYGCFAPGERHTKPNVLFIAVDDLRPELGSYGVEYIHSPHIDKLAAEGTVFANAYCNVAVCGASRASLMTGMRPIPRKRFRSWNSRADKDASGLPTIAEHFKNNGYYTISNGKVLHEQYDSPQAWSEVAWRSHDNPGASHYIYNEKEDWVDPASEALAGEPGTKEDGIYNGKRKGPFYEAGDVPDNGYHDGQLCDKTIADLRRLAKADQPFFLACGFWRPHLPFNAPKKYWDLYERESIPLANNRYFPQNAPELLKTSTELKTQYTADEGFPDDDEFHRLARHAYFACVSYIDAQVGKLMQELENLGLAENTIVVLWGDHGFHLGEHNFWGKHNTKDISVKAPLIIKSPGSKTLKAEQIVEFVDIYPTLCDLASIPTPEHCDGLSMEPIMEETKKEHKPAIFTTFGNAHAVKTKDFLYTEWEGTDIRMLFDHRTDRNENNNVANAENYSNIVKEMHELLECNRKELGYY